MKKVLFALFIMFNFAVSAKTCRVLVDVSNQMVIGDLRFLFGTDNVCTESLKCQNQTDFGLKLIENEIPVSKDHFGNMTYIKNEYYEVWKNGNIIKTISLNPYQMDQSLLNKLIEEVKDNYKCDFNPYILSSLGIDIDEIESIERSNIDESSIENDCHQVGQFPGAINCESSSKNPYHQVNNQ